MKYQKFYKELFEQEIELDLGKNVTFKGGFAIQEDFAWLTGINPDTIIQNQIIWNFILRLMILTNLLKTQLL